MKFSSLMPHLRAAETKLAENLVAAAPTSTARGRLVVACHHDPKPAFKLGEATVWGSSSMELHNIPLPWALALSVAPDSYFGRPAVELNSAAVQLLGPDAALFGGPMIKFDWPDNGVPRVNAEAWKVIVKVIKAMAPGGRIVVYCMGGHGRTGTALAILAALGNVMPADADPVAWLREHYCPEAIESTAQCEYITRITGRSTSQTGSYQFIDTRFDHGWRAASAQDAYGNAPSTVSGGAVMRPITNAAGDIVGWESDKIVTPRTGHKVIDYDAADYQNHAVTGTTRAELHSDNWFGSGAPRTGIDFCLCDPYVDETTVCDGWCRGEMK